MNPNGNFLPKLNHPNQQDLANLSLQNFVRKNGETIGILACQTPCNDFIFKVLIPQAASTSSTKIKILYTCETFLACEMRKLEALLKSTPVAMPALEDMVQPEKIESLEEFARLKLPNQLQFDKLFCINDLHFVNNLEQFFENLASNIMRSEGKIAVVVHFSKFMEIPRRLFAMDAWCKYDKSPSGELLPGYRAPTWACNSSTDHITTVLLSVVSRRFNILHRVIQDSHWKYKNFSEIFYNVMIPSHAESFHRVNEDSKLENSFAVITEMINALSVTSDTLSIGHDNKLQVPCTYLTFVAEKN